MGGTVQLPKAAAKLSVQEMLLDIENELGLERNPELSLTERLDRAEYTLYGEGKTGPVADRARGLYAALKGTQVISGEGVMPAPMESSQYSYLEEIFKVTDGKVVRWGKFPLRVYIEEPKDNPRYQPEFKQAVLSAMDVWKEKTQDVVSYVEVKNPDAADVRFFWVEQYVDRFADPETVPDFYQTYSPPKKNHMFRLLQVASMFAPGYFSLAPQAMGAMLQYKQLKKLEVIREESVVNLGLKPVEGLDPEQAQVLIQNMAAQEFGHVLGLKGHSPERGDLMYPELRYDTVQVPTRRDLETLRQLYNRPASIVLNVR